MGLRMGKCVFLCFIYIKESMIILPFCEKHIKYNMWAKLRFMIRKKNKKIHKKQKTHFLILGLITNHICFFFFGPSLMWVGERCFVVQRENKRGAAAKGKCQIWSSSSFFSLGKGVVWGMRKDFLDFLGNFGWI